MTPVVAGAGGGTGFDPVPDLLEGWDGTDLEDLRDERTEEEFQTVVDELEDIEGDLAP